MNIVNLFCLHFEKKSNVTFWTETSLISFSVFCKFCSLYFFIYRSNFISASPFNWMTSFIAFCLSCSFFSSYLLFSSVLLTSNITETNGLILLFVASTLSVDELNLVLYSFDGGGGWSTLLQHWVAFPKVLKEKSKKRGLMEAKCARSVC